MGKIILIFGSLLGAFAVILGAFGAHLLKNQLSSHMLAVYETAVRYHFYHAIVLIGLALLTFLYPNRFFIFSAIFFLLGTFLFSGSLYIYALTSIKWLAKITPIGGVLLIIGWFLLAIGAFAL